MTRTTASVESVLRATSERGFGARWRTPRATIRGPTAPPSFRLVPAALTFGATHVIRERASATVATGCRRDRHQCAVIVSEDRRFCLGNLSVRPVLPLVNVVLKRRSRSSLLDRYSPPLNSRKNHKSTRGILRWPRTCFHRSFYLVGMSRSVMSNPEQRVCRQSFLFCAYFARNKYVDWNFSVCRKGSGVRLFTLFIPKPMLPYGTVMVFTSPTCCAQRKRSLVGPSP